MDLYFTFCTITILLCYISKVYGIGLIHLVGGVGIQMESTIHPYQEKQFSDQVVALKTKQSHHQLDAELTHRGKNN